MIPDASKLILWLSYNPDILKNISRGIEREALRVTLKGELSQTNHPDFLGKSLTHPWITTDFSESLLEFITPVKYNVENLLIFLRDLHRHTSKHLHDELIWSLSMPCFIENQNLIKIAKYGTSNLGKFKTLYREGLKNRYGSLMQTISGIHYNFSFPIKFWKSFFNIKDYNSEKSKISNAYFHIIRNYYRFGWIIIYLFGSSPAIYNSFFKKKPLNLSFERIDEETSYLPYATSLRMSNIGYINYCYDISSSLNSLENYVFYLRKALKNTSEKFSKIGLYDKNHKYLQINTNFLQTENELYTPIRPKRSLNNDELLINSLLKKGVEYIEIRSLDINPFNEIGINNVQIYFLDLFIIWCLLIDSPMMNKKEFNFCKKNWDKVIFEGRKPGQKISMKYGESMISLKEVGYFIFNDLMKIADIFDTGNKKKYHNICLKLIKMFDNPDLTYSGRILPLFVNEGMNEYGLYLSKKYQLKLKQEKYEIITNKTFDNVKKKSILQQLLIENEDNISFEKYLNSYLKKI